MGLEKDDEFNVRWHCAARRVLKPEGTLWVSATHHIIFSIGFAPQRLSFKFINQIAWSKPNPVPSAAHSLYPPEGGRTPARTHPSSSPRRAQKDTVGTIPFLPYHETKRGAWMEDMVFDAKYAARIAANDVYV